MIFKLNLYLSTYALLGIVSNHNVNGEGLRGASATASKHSFTSYDEYIESMISTGSSQESSSSPLMNLSAGQYGSFPSLTQAKFPEGVFDMSKIDDPVYLNNLLGSCSTAITNNPNSSPGEKLACHLLYDLSWEQQQMAFGTLKLGVNLFDSMNDGSYQNSDINQFFKDTVLAVMIAEGCFYFDAGLNKEETLSVQFVDQSSYEKEVSNSDSFTLDTSATAYGVTVKAGYQKMSSSQNKQNFEQKYAFGKKQWYSPVGTLHNNCAKNEGLFKKVVLKNNLIKDTWLDKWNSVKAIQDLDEFKNNADFIDIVNGGFMMPDSYAYGASVQFTIESNYEAKKSESSNNMSKAISAGLGATFGGMGGSVDSKVENAVKNSLSDSSMNERVVVKSVANGDGVDVSCIKDDSCSTLLLKQVEEMRGNFNLVGKPLSHSTFVTLNDIVSWYTGSPLGSLFDEAVEKKLTYTCHPDDNSNQYIPGKNKWISGDNTAEGFCNEFEVCVEPGNDKLVYNPTELCQPVWLCKSPNQKGPDNCFIKEGVDMEGKNCCTLPDQTCNPDVSPIDFMAINMCH